MKGIYLSSLLRTLSARCGFSRSGRAKAALFIVLSAMIYPVAAQQVMPPRALVTFPDKYEVKADVAWTEEQREKGLMYVKSMPETRGMLFVFPYDSEMKFWMKNMFIDIDMVFISSYRRVTAVFSGVKKPQKGADDSQIPIVTGKGQYVLEIASGVAQSHGLKVGDELSMKFLSQKAAAAKTPVQPEAAPKPKKSVPVSTTEDILPPPAVN